MTAVLEPGPGRDGQRQSVDPALSPVDSSPPDAPARPEPRDAVRRLPGLMVGLGALGLAASTALMVEKVRLLQDPSYVPNCSLSPVLSCGSVMNSNQADLLGFPNPVLGLVGFTALLCTGLALLAGARLARWYWLGVQVGVLAGLGLVGWLVFQSLYRIGALCPYCMVVWAVTIALATAVTAHNSGTGVLPLPQPVAALVRDGAVLWPVLLYLTVTGLALVRFWDYWVSLL